MLSYLQGLTLPMSTHAHQTILNASFDKTFQELVQRMIGEADDQDRTNLWPQVCRLSHSRPISWRLPGCQGMVRG